ncbi:phospholipase D gamma 1-like [Cynara cardunculus var. scolymus]|uniref:phospholipase D gamma 1-like n=1 Tax=Cynara cardunculus var. scolymus TaxID=59895 RepID=UPI000D62F373|nr:phospholipase D gamma 1-like [Cynara cardunculus var. scolymus]
MAEIGYGGSQHGQSVEVIPFKTSNASLKVLLLHGNLDIWVKEAKNLPNMDMFHNKLGQVFGRMPTFSGKNKTDDGKPVKVTSDPYVTVSIANAVIARTFVISNSENPVWLQHFYVPVAHYSAEVQFVVKDSDVVGSQLIGAVGIPVEQLVSGSIVEGTFPILNESGKPCRPGAVLTLWIQYTPMERVPLSQNGVGSDPDCNGVSGTYFPLRRGGKVTLYQDAHVDDGCLPNMWLDGGLKYENGDCWHDICEAIKQARRLIYITGWSVFHSVQLVRNGDGAKDSFLGDLLKTKSSEGVRVLLLIWDDPTSRSILGIKTQGVMQTHDEETRRFFKHSSVQVLLCPRSAGKGHSWAKKQEVETIYTHHQKTVIVDADAGNYRRRIMAFVGGLDLCVGRYDTPRHRIFSTLQTVHKDDYHQPNFTGPTDGCPREPWHDLHSRIEGPAAYDLLKNFEERWLRASKPHGIRKIKKSSDDSLLKLDRIPDILGIDDAHCTSEQDPEGWHVQVFRSIDSNSVKGFPKDPKDATSKNLVCGKNVLIDMSIHTAYVKAIRAAQHFIYIENQYFLGSSFNWSNYKTLGANNLIPMEIALKIANKIRAKERFAAYIVIPMWPEGSPTSTAVQRILFWQNKTMQMMYEVIYKALVEVGLENVYEPQDYLIFFCLGTRESSKGTEPTSDEKGSNAANTPQSLSRKNQRFMIYVHSKGMIVDDEFVILGSANINQRSLEGSRDTEIAMGAYQPYHTWAHKRDSPHGQIFGYRMSLWAEHIGGLESCFERPESLECVRRVRLLSELNWKQYAAVEVSDMNAHLLRYPVEVDRTGQVKPLPGCPNFPDLGGNIVGTFVAIQENLTI